MRCMTSSVLIYTAQKVNSICKKKVNSVPPQLLLRQQGLQSTELILSEARQREEDVLFFGQWFCQIFRQIALMFVRAGHLSSGHIEKVQDSLPVVTCDERFFFRGKGVNRRTEKRRKTFLLASHTKREEGKPDRRLFLLTCVAQKRLCSFGIVCLAHVLRT